MSIPADYTCNQWGWFWRDSDNSGPYYLGDDGVMHQLGMSAGELTKDAWGVGKVSLPYSLFHGMWTYDIPAMMWFMYHNSVQVYASTDIASIGGVARLQTAGANTTVRMESRECPRYQPNRGHLFSTALWMPGRLLDAERDFGLFTIHNGVFFRLKSDGLLYAVLRSGDIEVREELIDTSLLPAFDAEKNNIYDIQFQWRSAGNYKFFIGDPEVGISRLVHVFRNLGTLTSASMENPALPVAFEVRKGTEDASMSVGCADVTSENGNLAVHQYNSAYAEAVAVSGTNVPVIVVYSPLQIAGKVNSRTVQLARISVNCSKKATFKVWMTRTPADITGATLAVLGAGSFIETDSPDSAAGAIRATAITVSPTIRLITAAPVEALVPREIDNPLREKITFPIVRGDYLVVTCTATTATADVVVEWGEQI